MMSSKILVVDDEPDIRFLLKDILEDEGYSVDVAEHARAANELRAVSQPDLVLLDIWMPDIDGVTLLKQWKASSIQDCPVVMMSGHGTVETAVEATRYGAYDFVEKPLSMAKLLRTVKAALNNSESSQKGGQQIVEMPVGDSQLVQDLKAAMESARHVNSAQFFVGNDGCGKQVWATYLSNLQQFSDGMIVYKVNSVEVIKKPEKTNLYIEEVTELSLDQQQQLLGILREIKHSGQAQFIIGCRYSYDQLKLKEGVYPGLAEYWQSAMNIPSLTDRIEDIPELLEYYVNWYAQKDKLNYRHFSVAAQNLIRNHHWSGELTELKEMIRFLLDESEEETVEPNEIQNYFQTASVGEQIVISFNQDLDLREAREQFERIYLKHQLDRCGNNISALARLVGQERTHLYRKLKSLGIQTKSRRASD